MSYQKNTLRLGTFQKRLMINIARSPGGTLVQPDGEIWIRIERLKELGLIVPKDGAPNMVVSTPLGREYVRKQTGFKL